MEAALAFYTGTPGFTVGYAYGDPPYDGQVVRDPDGNPILFFGR